MIASERSLWRYARALPIRRSQAWAYFGEGLTPLVARPWADRTVEFKLDYLLPTGSFKDRGAAILINVLRYLRIRAIREDSSGNAGASMSAYAAAAGMECTVYVSTDASPCKVAQSIAHGARLVRVPGDRELVQAAMVNDTSGGFCASHNWHPLFIEGVKTLGYELWEQTGWSCPDVVVAPIGGGSCVLGIYSAFRELFTRGVVPRIPRIYACQPANCPTFLSAWQGDWGGGVVGNQRPTVAEGLAITHPVRVAEVLRVFAETGGRPILTSEEEILSTGGQLARLGCYVEPTSAVAPAGAARLIRIGEIEPKERVVVILTGSGLKVPSRGLHDD